MVRSAILNSDISTQSLEKHLPTARTPAKPLRHLRASKHNEVQDVICTPHHCYLTPSTVACSYPGCKRPAVMYPADHFWNYCGESHEQYVPFRDLSDGNSPKGLCSYARKGCVSCRQANDNGTQLCVGCDVTFKQKGPAIIPIPRDHDAFWRGTGHVYLRHRSKLIPISMI